MPTVDRRFVTLVVVVLGVLLVVPFAFVGFGPMGHGPTMGGGMWGRTGALPGWILLFGFVVRILSLVAIVGAGYFVYRAITESQEDDALEELRLAYARGDLTDDEYEERRKTLERNA